jgi:hypothetical protein
MHAPAINTRKAFDYKPLIFQHVVANQCHHLCRFICLNLDIPRLQLSNGQSAYWLKHRHFPSEMISVLPDTTFIAVLSSIAYTGTESLLAHKDALAPQASG